MRVMTICLTAALLGGCAINPKNTDAAAGLNSPVAREIAAKERAFEACIDRRDAACAVNGFYVSDTDGPIASPPGGTSPVRGRQALTQMFGHALDDLQSVRLEQVEVIVRGDMADELGRSRVTLKNGKTVVGRFAVLWIRTADGWRAKLDFFADDGWSS